MYVISQSVGSYIFLNPKFVAVINGDADIGVNDMDTLHLAMEREENCNLSFTFEYFHRRFLYS